MMRTADVRQAARRPDGPGETRDGRDYETTREQDRRERRSARQYVTRMLSDAAFGGTWRGAKQPGRTYGPAPAVSVTRLDRIEPLDQQAREDRYRRQTGRINRCEAEQEAGLDYFIASERAALLGLTPKQRRRSEHKANRAEARLIPGGGRR